MVPGEYEVIRQVEQMLRCLNMLDEPGLSCGTAIESLLSAYHHWGIAQSILPEGTSEHTKLRLAEAAQLATLAKMGVKARCLLR